jgi:hypothetical protein
MLFIVFFDKLLKKKLARDAAGIYFPPLKAGSRGSCFVWTKKGSIASLALNLSRL